LAAGLAATIIIWIFVAAFAPEELDSLSGYSPWLYGPAATAAWALFSGIAYFLILHDRQRRAPLTSNETYRCRELEVAPMGSGCSVCASQEEKDRLGAVTSGFALTISGWVAALSFLPGSWLDWLGKEPAWMYCMVTITLWVSLSEAMYLIFHAGRTKLQ
jgi:hypothetical protein